MGVTCDTGKCGDNEQGRNFFSFVQNQIPKLAEKTENNDTQTTKQEAKHLAVLQTGMIPLLRKSNHSLLTTTVDNTLHY